MQSVFITGASTGIGRDAAIRMAKRGWSTFAGVRRPEDGAVLEELSHGSITPVKCDVTDPEQIAEAADQIMRFTNGLLSGLVNNAGIAKPAPIELIPLDDLREQFEVNVIGQVAVTQAFIPALRRGSGRIVNVGSLSGMLSPPIIGAYAMSKFAMEAMNDALRRELRDSKITVSMIQPGPIETPIWLKSLTHAQPLRDAMSDEHHSIYGAAIDALARAVSKEKEATVDIVSDAIEHALTDRRPKTRYPVGPNARRVTFLTRAFPDRLVDRLLRRN